MVRCFVVYRVEREGEADTVEAKLCNDVCDAGQRLASSIIRRLDEALAKDSTLGGDI